MVQMADHDWTLPAMHMACMRARSTGAAVVLMKMIPVQHPGYLGTDFGYWNLSQRDVDSTAYYQSIAEDYGVPCAVQYFQYATLPEALSDAAAYVDAHEVFAVLPEYSLPYWTRIQLWALRRRLTQQGRALYTSADSVEMDSEHDTGKMAVPQFDGKLPA